MTDISCGAAHTVASTEPGKVFSWGSADSLGVPRGSESHIGAPVIASQLENLVKAKKVFAGDHHTFVIAELPFKSVVGSEQE